MKLQQLKQDNDLEMISVSYLWWEFNEVSEKKSRFGILQRMI
jgi:hypothetical protein